MISSVSRLIACACAAAASICAPASAAPVTLHVHRPSSSIQFGVDSPSPTLTMNGSFKTFGGTMLVEPEGGFERAQLSLSLDVSSAQLPPDQILQAIFIQTALAHLKGRSGTFLSTSIEPASGNRYLVHGSYTWANRTRRASVPVELLDFAPSRGEIRLTLDGAVEPRDVKPEVSAVAPGIAGSEGWAKARIVFAPRS